MGSGEIGEVPMRRLVASKVSICGLVEGGVSVCGLDDGGEANSGGSRAKSSMASSARSRKAALIVGGKETRVGVMGPS
ncbi:unnamed protein product [Linum trigynum]|uniref:Uncharacterized protein n=1 Tax=Linum trigynum TaxID=586398 RepID=A0AAV2F5L8_9ROSI